MQWIGKYKCTNVMQFGVRPMRQGQTIAKLGIRDPAHKTGPIVPTDGGQFVPTDGGQSGHSFAMHNPRISMRNTPKMAVKLGGAHGSHGA